MHSRLAKLYRALTAIYPPTLRDEFGDDMVQAFTDQLRDAGASRRWAVLGRALTDLARSAPRERWEALRAVPLAATAGPPVAAVQVAPARRQRMATTRRRFLRHSLTVAGAGVGASMGGASLAYLWPNLREGFGAVVDAGTVAAVTEAVGAAGGTWAVPQARSYLVAYDPADDPDGAYAEVTGGTPFMALYQRCVHLGCRVPWCTSSTRFECPCHKSRYNRWGEWQDGPAPRGLDRFTVAISEGRVLVDTRTVITGPSRSGAVLDEPPSGASCLGA